MAVVEILLKNLETFFKPSVTGPKRKADKNCSRKNYDVATFAS